MATRSAILNATFMSCVIVTVVVASVRSISRINCAMTSLITGSSPVVGSSNSRISGLSEIARANPTQQRDDVLQRDTLPRARAADNHHRLAVGDVERHVDEHLLLAEGLVEMLKLDHQKSSFVKKKSDSRMMSDELTTACVVARPTPS